ncbi:MAG: hypothetical protein CVV60_05895 [Tenericutes bacterium HGW-Tenericutes-5]|nr:MAG: hypothetical protein CVV60_05895 [Tenericutes bacterium HGW-Tenericutes-5]
MKKLTSIFVLIIMTLGVTMNVAFAESTDLYDDATQNQYGSTEIELLANSNYQLTVFRDDEQWEANHFLQELSQDTLTLEISGITGWMFEGDSYDWESFATYTTTFSTTTAASLFIDVYSSNSNYNLALLYPNVDIQVVWLGNTEPIDEVPPQYTYSNVSVDTPYYDLVTVAEIQAQLQATDDEDGDVTDRIQVYEDHYTSITPKVVGDEYFIMFVVDDTAGNSAYLRVDIEVIDDKRPVMENGQDQYVNGSTINFTWYDDEMGEDENPIDEYQSYVSIIDEYYGTVVLDDINATSTGWIFAYTGDWGTFSPKTPGTYNLVTSVTDPSGNTMSYTMHVVINDNQAPVIAGEDALEIEVTDFNVNDIISQYSASDLEDGVLTVELAYSYTVTDYESEDYGTTYNYDYEWMNNPVLGVYTLYLKATDSYGVTTIKEVEITLIDTTAPIFKINNITTSNYSHTVYMSDTTSLQALIDSIIAIDAYDGELTLEMLVPAFPSFAVPGTHNLAITVTDSSSNVGTLTITVTVADDILPVINGATKIVKGKTEILTLSDILATLTATDNVDGSLTLELVQDGYSGNSGVIGSYLVKYKATDTAGNIKYHDVRIWVVDNQAPAWIINDYFVNLGVNEVMTRAELVSLLQSAGMIGSDISYTVTFLTDEYTGNETVEGAYSVVMNVTYEDGSESVLSLELNVPEYTDDDVIVVDPVPVQTGLQKFITGVTNVAKNVWEFIKSVASWIWDKLVWTYDHILVPVYEFIFVKDTPETIPPVTTETPLSNTTNNTTTMLLPVTSTSSPIQYL